MTTLPKTKANERTNEQNGRKVDSLDLGFEKVHRFWRKTKHLSSPISKRGFLVSRFKGRLEFSGKLPAIGNDKPKGLLTGSYLHHLRRNSETSSTYERTIREEEQNIFSLTIFFLAMSIKLSTSMFHEDRQARTRWHNHPKSIKQ